MRYLVTGATGFIGAEVVRQLAETGHQVVAIVRDPAQATAATKADGPLSQPEVHLVRGDITEKETLRAPMAGVDGVFHIAGWYKIGARDKTPAFTTNVEGTRNVLEVAGELAVGKIVYTSTLAVFSDTQGRVVDEDYSFAGNHISVYDASKWRAHYEVALPLIREGLPAVIVQPGVVYGPGDRGPIADTLVTYLRGRLPLIPEKSAYCWGHVVDTARAHLLAMDKGRIGESYIIAGPGHELSRVLAMAEQLTGVPLPRLHSSPRLLKTVSRLMGLIDRFHPLEGTFSPETLRVGAGTTYLGTNAKAVEELGISMRSIEEGLRESLAWYRALADEDEHEGSVIP
ncbi:MAG: SDR family NAD(P)-dependent oxidoreductase [Thermoleophilia bacterium]|nr:SDR family NAD(P)-dependent oxidoreductase [Thermoleophilia bacterium]